MKTGIRRMSTTGERIAVWDRRHSGGLDKIAGTIWEADAQHAGYTSIVGRAAQAAVVRGPQAGSADATLGQAVRC